MLPGKVQLPGDLPAPKKRLLHLLKHLFHLHINGRGVCFVGGSTFPWETSKFSLFGQFPFRLNMCLFVWRKDSFHLFLHLFLKCDPIETGTTPTSSFQIDASMVGCWFTLVLEPVDLALPHQWYESEIHRIDWAKTSSSPLKIGRAPAGSFFSDGFSGAMFADSFSEGKYM